MEGLLSTGPTPSSLCCLEFVGYVCILNVLVV